MSEEIALLGLHIQWLGGSCPVQAEGSYQGRELYFRARGTAWALHLTDPASGEVWSHEEEYGDGPFDAGYMPLEDAKAFILKAVAMFRDGLAPSVLDRPGIEAWLQLMRDEAPEAYAEWLERRGPSKVPGRGITFSELVAALPSPTP